MGTGDFWFSLFAMFSSSSFYHYLHFFRESSSFLSLFLSSVSICFPSMFLKFMNLEIFPRDFSVPLDFQSLPLYHHTSHDSYPHIFSVCLFFPLTTFLLLSFPCNPSFACVLSVHFYYCMPVHPLLAAIPHFMLLLLTSPLLTTPFLKEVWPKKISEFCLFVCLTFSI